MNHKAVVVDGITSGNQGSNIERVQEPGRPLLRGDAVCRCESDQGGGDCR
jgi:hypothetical protein